ncbi:MAG: hypothetical protein JNK58_08365 [Phycisphaerae bacterium]|nr:hypothetical protein [Phycisphaerae bacterium]
MAKGQHLSAYQKGIVKRYYEHQDTVLTQRLSELVSEVYLATGEKQADKLWKSVEQALAKTPVEPARIGKILATRDVKELARAVADLSPGGRLAR